MIIILGGIPGLELRPGQSPGMTDGAIHGRRGSVQRGQRRRGLILNALGHCLGRGSGSSDRLREVLGLRGVGDFVVGVLGLRLLLLLLVVSGGGGDVWGEGGLVGKFGHGGGVLDGGGGGAGGVDVAGDVGG